MDERKRSCCAITNFLDQLGDKWSLLILRDLFFHESREYGDFLPLTVGEKPSTNVLASRLKKLVELGYLHKAKHPSDGKKYVYTLSTKGQSLKPVLQSIMTWSLTHIPNTKAKELNTKNNQ